MNVDEIIKQILTNQQVLMMYLVGENKDIKECIEHEFNKTGEIILNMIKTNKRYFNCFYGITAIDYKNYRQKVINKIEEERMKFMEKSKNAIDINEKLLYHEIIEFLARLEFEI